MAARKRTKKQGATTPKNVNGLTANPQNPRKAWTAEQAQKFTESLNHFGDLSGVIFNQTSGLLVGGHKRVEAFQQEATPDIEISTRLPEPDATGTVAYGYLNLDGGKFSYREVLWDEEKEAAAGLAANKWGAEWDWQGVSDVLTQLGDYDLELTGFNESEYSPLLAAEWTPPEITDLPDGGDESDDNDGNDDSDSDALPDHYTLSRSTWEKLDEARSKAKLDTLDALVQSLLAETKKGK